MSPNIKYSNPNYARGHLNIKKKLPRDDVQINLTKNYSRKWNFVSKTEIKLCHFCCVLESLRVHVFLTLRDLAYSRLQNFDVQGDCNM